jgi:hypothetical protein
LVAAVAAVRCWSRDSSLLNAAAASDDEEVKSFAVERIQVLEAKRTASRDIQH